MSYCVPDERQEELVAATSFYHSAAKTSFSRQETYKPPYFARDLRSAKG